LTEELVEGISDEFDESALPERYKLAVRLTDVIVHEPTRMTDALRRDLLAEFTPEEVVELALTTALASAFSKAAIAWGPPDAIPVLEVPTPGPDRNV
jgi:alkylhydroperoxidase family enzyme